jgi:hypothetical protein
MEQAIAGKPEDQLIQAVQALLPALLEHWDDHQGFRRAGTPPFMREAGFAREEMAKAVTVVDQAFRQVPMLHHRQFRPYYKSEQLEGVYMRLVPSASDSPVRQGFLWLAFQVQAAVIDYLGSEAGLAAMQKIRKAVDEGKVVFRALMADPENLTPDKVEKVLFALTEKTLAEEADRFQLYAVVCSLIEFARREARQPPGQDLLALQREIPPAQVRLLAVLVEPVHTAELNEANHRFFRLKDGAKGRWFDVLRSFLDRHGSDLVKYAPLGFEKFSEAVEANLFPYPAQLEWMRAYLKPLYTNAQQSSVFDNCMTEASVRQRFEKLDSEKSSNKVMIELARAFALANLNKLGEPGQSEFLDTLNLKEEFQWPATLEELKAQLKP